jgi:hypothetical protein
MPCMYVTGTPRTWLRLEGGAVFVASLVAYHWQLGSWWLFVVAFLAPDLSMLGYLAGPSLGARAYNIVHIYVGPLFLVTYGVAIGRSDVVPWALIWFAHIGLDRLLGYGLKYDAAFGETHLGRLGRSPGGPRL